jgi:hypothetical protein
MLISSTTDLDSLITKYGMAVVQVDKDALYPWIQGNFVIDVRQSAGNYYLVFRGANAVDSVVYYDVTIILLDTTANSVGLKKSYTIKQSSFLDMKELLSDLFSLIV